MERHGIGIDPALVRQKVVISGGKMVSSCCIIGCSNRQKAGSSLSFLRIPPKSIARRKLWNKAINRVGKKGSLELWEPKSDLRVCSVHFESGKRYLLVGDPLDLDLDLELFFCTLRSRSRSISRPENILYYKIYYFLLYILCSNIFY